MVFNSVRDASIQLIDNYDNVDIPRYGGVDLNTQDDCVLHDVDETNFVEPIKIKNYDLEVLKNTLAKDSISCQLT